MSKTQKLWAGLAALLAVSFGILLFMGGEIHRKAPPMPEEVITGDGASVFTRADIETGRHRWTPARLDLGSRRLRRAGLDRRLAAP